jgi:hypothetical protein
MEMTGPLPQGPPHGCAGQTGWLTLTLTPSGTPIGRLAPLCHSGQELFQENIVIGGMLSLR